MSSFLGKEENHSIPSQFASHPSPSPIDNCTKYASITPNYLHDSSPTHALCPTYNPLFADLPWKYGVVAESTQYVARKLVLKRLLGH